MDLHYGYATFALWPTGSTEVTTSHLLPLLFVPPHTASSFLSHGCLWQCFQILKAKEPTKK